MVIHYEVRMRFEYRDRNGSRTELKATKKCFTPFVPAIGWRIAVEDDRTEVSAHVKEIWWTDSFNEPVIHTETQVYCDGDVYKSLEEHIGLLNHRGWDTTSCFLKG
jgi:hypothetical protein